MSTLPTRLYTPSRWDLIEDIEDYRPGGLHPVHLEDLYDHDRYRIINKLGFGGFATVWLARDEKMQRYVALKILVAEVSEDCPDLKVLQHLQNSQLTDKHPGRSRVAHLLDSFRITGPNGSHLCLVSEVGGPSISQLAKEQIGGRYSGAVAHEIASQVTQALDFMHSSGACHGDLTPSNVLFQLTKEFDSWSEDEITDRLGGRSCETMFYVGGYETPAAESNAPEYIVEPAELGSIDPCWLEPNIKVIDFGQSFLVDAPPTGGVGTPYSYRAPEALFDRQAGMKSDLWALGCTIFELRAGHPLFYTFFGSAEEAMLGYVSTLGKMPVPTWWSRWDLRTELFEDDGTPKPVWMEDSYEYPLARKVDDIGSEDSGSDSIDAVLSEAEKPDLSDQRRTKISPGEAASLKDLLGKLVRYVPEERITAAEVARHEWFTTSWSAREHEREVEDETCGS